MSDCPRRTAVFAALALVAIATVPSLFTRDLWQPDEPRYMEVAREMVATGDYVIPRLNGKIYSEKPPLFFWLSGMLWRLGAGYGSGRVVSALAVMGTMAVLIFAFARSLGSGTALLAAGVSLTTGLLLSLAKVGNLDPLLMLEVTCVIALGHRALHGHGSSAGLCWLGAYAAAGASLLTKGPVGLLIPALVLGLYATIRRREIRLGGWWHLGGGAVCTATALAWVVPAVLVGGEDYARIILLKQTVGRAVASFSHPEPFYYYVWAAPMAWLPWSLFLPPAVAAAWRRRAGDSGGIPLLAALWVLVPLVFLTFMSGKKVTYILPCVPGLGLLVAWYLAPGPERGRGVAPLDRWLSVAALVPVGLMCILCGALLFVGPAVVQLIYPDGPYAAALSEARTAPTVVAGALGLVVALVLVGLAVRASGTDRHRMAVLACAGLLALSLAQDVALVPAVNVYRSDRHFGEAVGRRAGESGDVYLYLNDFHGAINLYSERSVLPVVRDHGAVAQVLKEPGALVVADEFDLLKYGPGDWREYVVLAQEVARRRLVLLRGRSRGPAPADADTDSPATGGGAGAE